MGDYFIRRYKRLDWLYYNLSLSEDACERRYWLWRIKHFLRYEKWYHTAYKDGSYTVVAD